MSGRLATRALSSAFARVVPRALAGLSATLLGAACPDVARSEAVGAAGAPTAGAARAAETPAAALLADYAARFPVPTGPWTGIGELSAARRRLAPRERELLERLADDPGPAVDLELGRVYTVAAETARGAAFLTRAARAAPTDADAWMWLGANRLSVGEVEDALALLEHARSLDGSSAEVHGYLGEARLRAGDAAAASASFRRAIELDPASGDSRVALAALLEDAGELAPAREHLLAALETRPEDQRIPFRLARIARALGHEDEAREHAARHARLVALDDLGLLGIGAAPAAQAAQLGIHYLENGLPAEALAEFERVLQAEASPNARLNALAGRAWALVGLGRPDEARAALDALRAFAPGHPDAPRIQALLSDGE